MSSQSSFEQSNNNVVTFPGPRAKSIAVIEETSNDSEESDREYVGAVIEGYARSISDELHEMGFDVSMEGFNKHFSFTMESFRSTLLLALGLDHPFQEIIEAAVETLVEEEPS